MNLTREEKIMKIVALLTEASQILASIEEPVQYEPEGLADFAEDALGIDVSPRDLAPDELGCAESVTNLIRQMVPGFPIITGTWTLWDRMNNDGRFEQVDKPIAGDIIISPTGTVRNAPFPGHVGIMQTSTKIMANHSDSGQWRQDYTVSTWNRRWKRAGFPVLFYRLK